jgi:hypothetical protein
MRDPEAVDGDNVECITVRAIGLVEPAGSISPSAPIINRSMIGIGRMRSPSFTKAAADVARSVIRDLPQFLRSIVTRERLFQ